LGGKFTFAGHGADRVHTIKDSSMVVASAMCVHWLLLLLLLFGSQLFVLPTRCQPADHPQLTNCLTE